MKRRTTANDRAEYLCILYDATYAEISRLRDYEWRIAYYFIVLTLGAGGLVLSDAARPVVTSAVRIVLTALLMSGQMLGTYLLWQTHLWLTQQRNIRRKLEDLMGFYDDGSYTPEPLLPWKGHAVTPAFQAFDLVFPLMLGIVVVGCIVIYLVWRVGS